MTAPTVAATGIDGFIAGLAAQGIEAERVGQLIVYRVEPLAGPHAGRPVETAVAASELGGWPLTPPHWVHLRDDVKLDGPQPSEKAGWSRYSRPHPGRIDASENPAQAWVAHIRELLGRAT